MTKQFRLLLSLLLLIFVGGVSNAQTGEILTYQTKYDNNLPNGMFVTYNGRFSVSIQSQTYYNSGYVSKEVKGIISEKQGKGTIVIKVPAGAKKLHFHGFSGTENENVVVNVRFGSSNTSQITLPYRSDITPSTNQSNTFVIGSKGAIYYYSVDFGQTLTEDTEVTFVTQAYSKSFALYGVNAEMEAYSLYKGSDGQKVRMTYDFLNKMYSVSTTMAAAEEFAFLDAAGNSYASIAELSADDVVKKDHCTNISVAHGHNFVMGCAGTFTYTLKYADGGLRMNVSGNWPKNYYLCYTDGTDQQVPFVKNDNGEYVLTHALAGQTGFWFVCNDGGVETMLYGPLDNNGNINLRWYNCTNVQLRPQSASTGDLKVGLPAEWNGELTYTINDSGETPLLTVTGWPEPDIRITSDCDISPIVGNSFDMTNNGDGTFSKKMLLTQQFLDANAGQIGVNFIDARGGGWLQLTAPEGNCWIGTADSQDFSLMPKEDAPRFSMNVPGAYVFTVNPQELTLHVEKLTGFYWKSTEEKFTRNEQNGTYELTKTYNPENEPSGFWIEDETRTVLASVNSDRDGFVNNRNHQNLTLQAGGGNYQLNLPGTYTFVLTPNENGMSLDVRRGEEDVWPQPQIQTVAGGYEFDLKYDSQTGTYRDQVMLYVNKPFYFKDTTYGGFIKFGYADQNEVIDATSEEAEVTAMYYAPRNDERAKGFEVSSTGAYILELIPNGNDMGYVVRLAPIKQYSLNLRDPNNQSVPPTTIPFEQIAMTRTYTLQQQLTEGWDFWITNTETGEAFGAPQGGQTTISRTNSQGITLASSGEIFNIASGGNLTFHLEETPNGLYMNIDGLPTEYNIEVGAKRYKFDDNGDGTYSATIEVEQEDMGSNRYCFTTTYEDDVQFGVQYSTEFNQAFQANTLSQDVMQNMPFGPFQSAPEYMNLPLPVGRYKVTINPELGLLSVTWLSQYDNLQFYMYVNQESIDFVNNGDGTYSANNIHMEVPENSLLSLAVFDSNNAQYACTQSNSVFNAEHWQLPIQLVNGEVDTWIFAVEQTGDYNFTLDMINKTLTAKKVSFSIQHGNEYLPMSKNPDTGNYEARLAIDESMVSYWFQITDQDYVTFAATSDEQGDLTQGGTITLANSGSLYMLGIKAPGEYDVTFNPQTLQLTVAKAQPKYVLLYKDDNDNEFRVDFVPTDGNTFQAVPSVELRVGTEFFILADNTASFLRTSSANRKLTRHNSTDVALYKNNDNLRNFVLMETGYFTFTIHEVENAEQNSQQQITVTGWAEPAWELSVGEENTPFQLQEDGTFSYHLNVTDDVVNDDNPYFWFQVKDGDYLYGALSMEQQDVTQGGVVDLRNYEIDNGAPCMLRITETGEYDFVIDDLTRKMTVTCNTRKFYILGNTAELGGYDLTQMKRMTFNEQANAYEYVLNVEEDSPVYFSVGTQKMSGSTEGDWNNFNANYRYAPQFDTSVELTQDNTPIQLVQQKGEMRISTPGTYRISINAETLMLSLVEDGIHQPLYIMGSVNNWQVGETVKEMPFNPQTNAYEYEFTSDGNASILFLDRRPATWDELSQAIKYSVVNDGTQYYLHADEPTVTLQESTTGDAEFLLAPGTYKLSISSDRTQLTVTWPEDAENSYYIRNQIGGMSPMAQNSDGTFVSQVSVTREYLERLDPHLYSLVLVSGTGYFYGSTKDSGTLVTEDNCQGLDVRKENSLLNVNNYFNLNEIGQYTITFDPQQQKLTFVRPQRNFILMATMPDGFENPSKYFTMGDDGHTYTATINVTEEALAAAIEQYQGYSFSVYDNTGFYGYEGNTITLTSDQTNLPLDFIGYDFEKTYSFKADQPGDYTFTLNCADPSNITLSIKVPGISQLDNAIYVEEQSVLQGAVGATISVKLKNTTEIGAYSFDLTLPEGVEIIQNEAGKYMISLSDRHADHTITANKQGDHYSISVIKFGNDAALSGNDGEIMNISLSIPDDISLGSHPVSISNVGASTPDGTDVEMPNTSGTINITGILMGDVNGDGKVSISDAVAIVNWIVGNPNVVFIEKAVDINNDNKKTIADAVTIVNLVVGGDSDNDASSAKSMEWDDLDPE